MRKCTNIFTIYEGVASHIWLCNRSDSEDSVDGNYQLRMIVSPIWIRTYKDGCIFYVTDGNIMYLTDSSRFLISCVIQHYAPVVGWRNRCIMLIMSLYPSWRQTLRLPPLGIEPGSPASQAGTLPKDRVWQFITEFLKCETEFIFWLFGTWLGW